MTQQHSVESPTSNLASRQAVTLSRTQLLEGFEKSSLPPGSFHHREHVLVAWTYLERYPLIEALGRFTSGIKRLAAAHGADQLYHETITWAYVLLIQERRHTSKADSWAEFAAQNADLLTWNPSILERYYRAETLCSPLAKKSFLMPDRLSEEG